MRTEDRTALLPTFAVRALKCQHEAMPQIPTLSFDIIGGHEGGARIGRPPKLNPRQITIAKKKTASGHSRVQVARRLGVSVGTLRAGITRSASENHRQTRNGSKQSGRKRAAGVCP
jgi:DNA-binding CsgD family transcriptional regulator